MGKSEGFVKEFAFLKLWSLYGYIAFDCQDNHKNYGIFVLMKQVVEVPLFWIRAKVLSAKIYYAPGDRRVRSESVTAFDRLRGLMVGLRRTRGSAWSNHSGRANDGMPFKEKVGLTEKKCFDFSLFIGVRGIEVPYIVKYCGTLETERQEKQRKQIKPKWRNYIMSTRLKYIIPLGKTWTALPSIPARANRYAHIGSYVCCDAGVEHTYTFTNNKCVNLKFSVSSSESS